MHRNYYFIFTITSYYYFIVLANSAIQIEAFKGSQNLKLKTKYKFYMVAIFFSYILCRRNLNCLPFGIYQSLYRVSGHYIDSLWYYYLKNWHICHVDIGR